VPRTGGRAYFLCESRDCGMNEANARVFRKVAKWMQLTEKALTCVRASFLGHELLLEPLLRTFRETFLSAEYASDEAIGRSNRRCK